MAESTGRSGRGLADLRRKLVAYFDHQELQTLCFDLRVDYDVLPGEGKAAKARELVSYLHRRGRLQELAAACAALRPDVTWEVPPELAEAAEPSPVETDSPWWDAVPNRVGGDLIIAHVGAGARGVSVGKNITQTLHDTLGAPGPDDKQVIQGCLSQVAAALQKLPDRVDAAVVKTAEFQLRLLQGELLKTQEDETPSASTIVQVGDWLLDNVPPLVGDLADLFRAPAVGRVMAKAGETAVLWAKERFGDDV